MSIRSSVIGLASLAVMASAAVSWNDTLTFFNDTLWVQQTDIEHCNDGACFQARPDHLLYTPDGLVAQMNMKPCNTTGCCVGTKCANWAAGHMFTLDDYLYGTYEIRAQPVHSPDGSIPPRNTFSCWTPMYTSSPVHNELAVCFSGLDSRNIHFSYWYDATAHTTKIDLPFDWSAAMHDYKVVWAPDHVDWYVDGEILHTTTGTAGKTIPYLAGHEIVIIRPKNDTYISDSLFSVAWMSYTSDYA